LRLFAPFLKEINLIKKKVLYSRLYGTQKITLHTIGILG